MKLRYVIPIVIFCLAIVIMEGQSQEKEMRTYFEEKGEVVLDIDQKTFDSGPFFMKGKGVEVYKVELEDGNTCWVKFGFTSTEYITLDKDGNTIEKVKR